jgi:aquaporin Z
MTAELDPDGVQPTVREATWLHDFEELGHEWRRLFSEVFGTFLLVLAGAGPAVVAASVHVELGRGAEVTAPALTVLAVILFMGKVSGAHLNPVVTLAFCLRRDFSWRRVPGYLLASWPVRSAPVFSPG